MDKLRQKRVDLILFEICRVSFRLAVHKGIEPCFAGRRCLCRQSERFCLPEEYAVNLFRNCVAFQCLAEEHPKLLLIASAKRVSQSKERTTLLFLFFIKLVFRDLFRSLFELLQDFFRQLTFEKYENIRRFLDRVDLIDNKVADLRRLEGPVHENNLLILKKALRLGQFFEEIRSNLVACDHANRGIRFLSPKSIQKSMRFLSRCLYISAMNYVKHLFDLLHLTPIITYFGVSHADDSLNIF